MAINREVQKLHRERAYHVRKQYEIERQLNHWVEYGNVPRPQVIDGLLTLLERAVGALVDRALARLERYRKP